MITNMNQTYHLDYPALTMFQMVERMAKETPDAPAYEFFGRQVSYQAFVQRIECPTCLVVAADGMLARHTALLEQLPFEQVRLPGGHHLHLNDEQGATLVADCINRFCGFS